MPAKRRRNERTKAVRKTQPRAATRSRPVVFLTRPPARYCARCGTRMKSMPEHGVMRPTCPACGFIAYRNPAPACGALLEKDGTILLARRGHPPRLDAWGIPAGFMEYGEHPETTAVREVLEETGLRVRLTGLFGVYAGRDDPRTRAVLILYRARIVGGRLQAGDDASEVGFFPLDRLPRPIAFRAHREALRDLERLNRAARRSRKAGPAKKGRRKTTPSKAAKSRRSHTA